MSCRTHVDSAGGLLRRRKNRTTRRPDCRGAVALDCDALVDRCQNTRTVLRQEWPASTVNRAAAPSRARREWSVASISIANLSASESPAGTTMPFRPPSISSAVPAWSEMITARPADIASRVTSPYASDIDGSTNRSEDRIRLAMSACERVGVQCTLGGRLVISSGLTSGPMSSNRMSSERSCRAALIRNEIPLRWDIWPT